MDTKGAMWTNNMGGLPEVVLERWMDCIQGQGFTICTSLLGSDIGGRSVAHLLVSGGKPRQAGASPQPLFSPLFSSESKLRHNQGCNSSRRTELEAVLDTY